MLNKQNKEKSKGRKGGSLCEDMLIERKQTSAVHELMPPPGGHSGTFQNFEIFIPRSPRSIPEGGVFCHLPRVVPSSPMITFIEVIICWATGGDMEVA